MNKQLRFRRWIKLSIAVAIAITFGVPVVHLAITAAQDDNSLQPILAEHADDASRLSAARVQEIWPVPAASDAAEWQLIELLNRAQREQLPVSIAGTRHSMGGHTIAADGIVIDMLPLRSMKLNPDGTVLTVQAGALWDEVIAFLNEHGRSVAIMQSDSSFSVGGSLSANVHGWQAKRAPISSSVKSFRLLMADGRILQCSREENAELFSLALGGYGLFGIILDAQLWTALNAWYEVERYSIPVEQFSNVLHRLVDGDESVEMAYGRLRVTQKSFLEDAILTVYRKAEDVNQPLPLLEPVALDPLKRTVFRSSVGSDYGKRLRWNLEGAFGEKVGASIVSRNQLLNSPVSLYSNRKDDQTDILHEYFVPAHQLADFLAQARNIITQHGLDLLNVTLRDVREDNDTFLRYADQNMIAVVMLFSQARTKVAETRMQKMTRELIAASLNVGGRYYLPYRPHASPEQFLQAYPQAEKFVALKLKYDPHGLFSNQFYTRYLTQLKSDSKEDQSYTPMEPAP